MNRRKFLSIVPICIPLNQELMNAVIPEWELKVHDSWSYNMDYRTLIIELFRICPYDNSLLFIDTHFGNFSFKRTYEQVSDKTHYFKVSKESCNIINRRTGRIGVEFQNWVYKDYKFKMLEMNKE